MRGHAHDELWRHGLEQNSLWRHDLETLSVFGVSLLSACKSWWTRRWVFGNLRRHNARLTLPLCYVLHVVSGLCLFAAAVVFFSVYIYWESAMLTDLLDAIKTYKGTLIHEWNQSYGNVVDSLLCWRVFISVSHPTSMQYIIWICPLFVFYWFCFRGTNSLGGYVSQCYVSTAKPVWNDQWPPRWAPEGREVSQKVVVIDRFHCTLFEVV